MSKDLVRTFKLFWPDQDQEQETWLRAQARAGLHLERVNVLQVRTFRRGPPADVAYRIDFTNKGKDPLYRQLFADAGWEHVADVAGWQYWRKAVTKGAVPEIFTDNASKIAKLRRQIALIALCIAPILITGTTLMPEHLARMSPASQLPLVAVYTLLPLIYAYMALRLFKRIRQLSQPAAS